jgi:uncharacterized protein (TIGR00288 family)
MYDFDEIKKVGIFIDGENVNSKDIEIIIEEIKKFGRIIVNRVYGDWSTPIWNQWKQYCIKEGLEPIHCAKLPKKNSVDIRLIDDIYECLFVNSNIDIYALVSTDADFLTVARRVKRHGKIFITVGYSQCSEILKNVCDKFIAIEMLRMDFTEAEETNGINDEESDVELDINVSHDDSKFTDKVEEQYNIIKSLFDNDKKFIHISNLKTRLKKRYKNYKEIFGNITKIESLIEKNFKKEFKIIKKKESQKNGQKERQIIIIYDLSGYNSKKYRYLQEQIAEVFDYLGTKNIMLSVLKDKLTLMTNNFDQRIYGFNRFKDFINEIFDDTYELIDVNGSIYITQK